MLASPHVIAEVADCARWADRLVRADLIHGFVVTENDYTSNFTSAFRREINSRRLPGLSAHSQVLTPSVERRTGTDGCIVFHNQSVFKVGLFEGKWPRLSTHLNYWDSIQKSGGRSHFDDQLARQAALSGYAIWEMFYSEEPYGPTSCFPMKDLLVSGTMMLSLTPQAGIKHHPGLMRNSHHSFRPKERISVKLLRQFVNVRKVKRCRQARCKTIYGISE
ncbi:hypothetical protein [Leptonema illini]|uniref:Uncharacterized protein n=1 Tax=Leptonema illini DSM 21528 TaxID=929563 RepID=H2CEG6_9LEPT|nr:hypothetical protein [Leptonema illini]EHQ05552.1 hypothetical protein Lepil_0851 [Leptonema illini DSM 21528]